MQRRTQVIELCAVLTTALKVPRSHLTSRSHSFPVFFWMSDGLRKIRLHVRRIQSSEPTLAIVQIKCWKVWEQQLLTYTYTYLRSTSTDGQEILLTPCDTRAVDGSKCSPPTEPQPIISQQRATCPCAVQPLSCTGANAGSSGHLSRNRSDSFDKIGGQPTGLFRWGRDVKIKNRY